MECGPQTQTMPDHANQQPPVTVEGLGTVSSGSSRSVCCFKFACYTYDIEAFVRRYSVLDFESFRLALADKANSLFEQALK